MSQSTDPPEPTAAAGGQADPEGPAAGIAAGYAFTGPALELGALLWDGACLPGRRIRVPLSVLNRHGLVAGATGTGKTKTLQLIAEQLSANGVPVFLADVKGDLSGISAPGAPGGRTAERATEVGQAWEATGYPAAFYSLGGIGPGIPLRASVTAFGPVLMSKVLRLNPTQEQSLGLIFHYADSKGLELIDLKDLRAVVAFLVSDQGKPELKGIGGLSTATAGVILRALTAFEQQGASEFFGEPEFDTGEFLRTAPDGRGVISVLELPAVQDKPQLFSTFLMWLLADLYAGLPEVGDPERPRLVFFFDEAHLLFNGASKAFLESV
ncbi:ATPase, partial [Streptomyces sp. RSD-27]